METTFPTGSIGILRGVQEVRTDTASPGAGLEWTVTVDRGYYRRLLSGSCQFVTSAAAANRNIGIRITDGVNIVSQMINNNALVASNTFVVTFSPSTAATAAAGTKGSAHVPIDAVWLPPGYTLGTITNNIDAADQYSKIVLWWECIDRTRMEEHHADVVAWFENSPITINE